MMKLYIKGHWCAVNYLPGMKNTRQFSDTPHHQGNPLVLGVYHTQNEFIAVDPVKTLQSKA